MSLASRLAAAKSNLRQSTTRVTCPDGKVYLEHEGVQIYTDEESAGFVVDTKPDLSLSEIISPWLFLGSQDVAADKSILR